MFLSIAHYDANRKGRVKNVEREANGRPSRRNNKRNVVYFVEIEGEPFIKVGRTAQPTQRMLQYESAHGKGVRYAAQFDVGTEAEAIVLERDMIRHLSKDYERRGLEWFRLPPGHLGLIIGAIAEISPVTVKAVRGAPNAKEVECEDHNAAVLFTKHTRAAYVSRSQKRCRSVAR